MFTSSYEAGRRSAKIGGLTLTWIPGRAAEYWWRRQRSLTRVSGADQQFWMPEVLPAQPHPLLHLPLQARSAPPGYREIYTLMAPDGIAASVFTVERVGT